MTRRDSARESDTTRPIAVDLFAGAGGMSLGFERAGFDVVAAFDNDPIHCATHAYNFPLAAVRCSDVSVLGALDVKAAIGDGLRRHGRPVRSASRIDCLFGGPSCQGFSEIGRNQLDDPRNELVVHFARLVGELRPRYFVMENVPGFAARRYSATRDLLLRTFSDAGYKLLGDDYVLLEASEYGVPQIRKRVFVIGAHEAEAVPQKPLPAPYIVTSREALGDLPEVGAIDMLLDHDEALIDDAIRAACAAPSPYVVALNRPRAGHLANERRARHDLLTNSARTTHSPEVLRRLARLGPGEVDAISRLRRLDPGRPSQTLRAGTGRDHGSFTASRPVHFASARVITTREAARLHSFPDWFRFHATRWHGFRQVGNAVPPLLAEAVASVIVSAAGAEPRRPTGAVRSGVDEWLRFTLLDAADHFGYDRALLPRDVRRNKSQGGRRRGDSN